jgi:hypothetical protein
MTSRRRFLAQLAQTSAGLFVPVLIKPAPKVFDMRKNFGWLDRKNFGWLDLSPRLYGYPVVIGNWPIDWNMKIEVFAHLPYRTVFHESSPFSPQHGRYTFYSNHPQAGPEKGHFRLGPELDRAVPVE